MCPALSARRRYDSDVELSGRSARDRARVAGAAMSAMMTLSSATAQIPFQIPSGQQEKSTASVAGTVQNIVKDAIADALIELTRNGSAEKLIVHTDQHGKFLVEFMSPGAYTIRIHSPGFVNYTKQISVESRQDLRITATMDLGLLMGAVVPEVVPVTVEIAHRQLTAQ